MINTKLQGDAAIPRNPGVVTLVSTQKYSVFRAGKSSATGWLIDMGEFESVEWFAEGRPATRAEVEYSVGTGLPLLYKACNKEETEEDVGHAYQALRKAYTASKVWWPTA